MTPREAISGAVEAMNRASTPLDVAELALSLLANLGPLSGECGAHEIHNPHAFALGSANGIAHVALRRIRELKSA